MFFYVHPVLVIGLMENFSHKLLFKLHEAWLVDSQENRYNCYHRLSDFKTKMHQFDFSWGSAPRPTGGAYSAPPDLLVGIKGAYLYENGGKEKGKEEGKGRRGWDKQGGWSPLTFQTKVMPMDITNWKQ